MARAAGSRQGDGRVGDRGLARFLDAVVVGVDVDVTRERGQAGKQFTKVIVDAVDVLRERDGGDHVVAGGSGSRRSLGGLAVKVVGGLRLGDGVAAGTEVGEVVGPGAVGRRGQTDRSAEVVGSGQADGGVGNRGLAGFLVTVVVGVDIDESGKGRRQQFAEVVVDALDALCERDGGDDVVAGGSGSRRSLGGLAVEIAGRLRLGDGVGARLEVGEVVGTGAVSRCREINVLARAGRSCQGDRCVGNRGLARFLDPVVIGVDVDEARNR